MMIFDHSKSKFGLILVIYDFKRSIICVKFKNFKLFVKMPNLLLTLFPIEVNLKSNL